jgi:hypothetical protein
VGGTLGPAFQIALQPAEVDPRREGGCAMSRPPPMEETVVRAMELRQRFATQKNALVCWTFTFN